MSLPTLEPIADADLPGFCRFLSENLSRDRAAEEWAKAFTQDWCPSKPNNGFLIRHEGRIVGGIGAIYAERPIRGRTERFCNITSFSFSGAPSFWRALSRCSLRPRRGSPPSPRADHSSILLLWRNTPARSRAVALFLPHRRLA